MNKKVWLGIVFLLTITSVYGLQDLIALQGSAKDLGLAISNGNITVGIYTQASGGPQVYSHTFVNAISNGYFDITLGEPSDMSLDYGTIYYLDMTVNGQNLNFNGSDRKAFQSTSGKVGADFIKTDSINSSHIIDGSIIDADVNANADISKSKISNTGIWLANEIPNLTSSWTNTVDYSRIANANLLNVNNSQYLQGYSATNFLNNDSAISGRVDSLNNTKAIAANCPAGQVVQNTTTSGVQCVSPGGIGTVTNIIAGVGLTGGSITGSGTIGINTTYLSDNYLNISDQRYNETSLINGKLDATDQRYNETAKIISVNSSTNIKSLGFNITTELKTYFDTLYYAIGNPTSYITSSIGVLTNFYNKTESDARYLQLTDQRYNETSLINGKLDATDQRYNETTAFQTADNLKLNITDQRYNDTGSIITLQNNLGVTNTTANNALSYVVIANNTANLANTTVNGHTNSITALQNNLVATNNTANSANTKIDAVNSSANIKSLGFNITTELKTYFDTLYYAIGNPTSYITSSIGVLTNFYNKTESDARYLQLADQRYNETSLINGKLDATDQRYNETTKINAINTTTNIQSLGFNTTTQLQSTFYSVNNPNAFVNKTLTDSWYYNTTYMDTFISRQNNRYAGFKVLPNWTNNGDGSITFSAGNVALYSTTDFTGAVNAYNVLGGTTGIAGVDSLPDGMVSFLVAEYNGGSPKIQLITNRDLIHQSNVVPFLTITRNGNELYVLNWGDMGNGLPEKINDRLVRTDRYNIETGLVLDQKENNTLTSTSGVLWYGTTRLLLDAVDTTTSGIDIYYHNANGSYIVDENIANGKYYNDVWDNGTGLITLDNGTYANVWVYRNIKQPAEIDVIVGHAQYNSESEALLGQPPNIVPLSIQYNYILIGRITFLKGASTGIVGAVGALSFTNSGVTDHNSLGNMQGGANGEYYHLSSNEYQNTKNIAGMITTNPGYGVISVNDVADINQQNTLSVTTAIKSKAGYLSFVSYNNNTDLSTLNVIGGDTSAIYYAYTIYDGNSNGYYVMPNPINITALTVKGNASNIVGGSWSYKQAPYIDVNTQTSNEEKGISFSTNKIWQWGLYVPASLNDSRACIFDQVDDRMCWNNDGTAVMNGNLTADNLYTIPQINSLIALVNSSANIQSLGFNTSSQLNNLYLGITDQRYNETVKINAVNTTANNAINYVVIANNTANLANTTANGHTNSITALQNNLVVTNNTANSATNNLVATNTTANNAINYVVIANNTANLANTTANGHTTSITALQNNLVVTNNTANSATNNLVATNTTANNAINYVVIANTTANTANTTANSHSTSITALQNNLVVTNNTANSATNNLVATNTTANNAINYVVIANNTANLANTTANSHSTSITALQNNLVVTNNTANTANTLATNVGNNLVVTNNTANSATNNLAVTNTTANNAINYVVIANNTANLANTTANGHTTSITALQNNLIVTNNTANSATNNLVATNTTANNAINYVVIANNTANIANNTANSVTNNLVVTNNTANTCTANLGTANTSLNSRIDILNTTLAIQGLGFNTTAQLDVRYLQTTPYQSYAAGWGNTSTTTNTSSNVAIGGNITTEGYLDIDAGNAKPSAPSENYTRIFASQVAGRNTLSVMGSAGIDYVMAPSNIDRRTALISFIGSGTALTGYGDALAYTSGTGSTPTMNIADGLAVNIVATAVTGAGVSGNNIWARNFSTFAYFRFKGVEASGVRFFVGMSDQTLAVTTASDTAIGNYTGVRIGGNNSNWMILSRNSSNYQVNYTLPLAYDTNMHEVKIWLPNDGPCYVQLDSYPVYKFNASQCPNNNALMKYMVGFTNTTSAFKNIRVGRVYLEAER